MQFRIATVSSLDKVFCNGEPRLYESEFSCLKNERFHFQVALYSETEYRPNVHVSVRSDDPSDSVTVRLVEHIPARFARKLQNADDYVIFRENTATLYPDLLRPIADNGIRLLPQQWQTLWVTVEGRAGALTPGKHTFSVTAEDAIGLRLTAEYTLDVLDESLPEQSLIYTNWMHYDCICDKHNCRPFSAKFYRVFRNYLRLAVSRGMNMLYVPLFTPPLDTAVGGERRTVQLIGVRKTTDGYAFDFSELETFLETARDVGVRYFEMSHLATQWGGAYCPKIVGEQDGKMRRLFGWDTSSVSAEYIRFLRAFMPELDAFLTEKGYKSYTYFHISDEPYPECYDGYKAASDAIKPILQGYTFMDAMSHAVFVNDGLVDIPVVATTAYRDFKREVTRDTDVWVYYCGGQYANQASNRYFNMSSARNRVFGLQAYANRVKGFLHWGYNFYNAQYSLYEIDPYFVSDADGSFISGDSYVVYPYKNTALASLRLEVFYDGLQDMRALQLLESKIGRSRVDELLAEYGVHGFNAYPADDNFIRTFRLRVNKMLTENL